MNKVILKVNVKKKKMLFQSERETNISHSLYRWDLNKILNVTS